MYDVTAGIETHDGGRRVACRVPLPVAPGVVWDAVATGEGISSWFVPCALEPQVGGRIVQFADPGAPDPTTGPEAALTLILSAPVDGVLELFAFPAGETHEDAAGRAAIAVRAYEYVEAPGGTGEPLGAAAVDGVEPTWDASRWRAWLGGLIAD